MRSRPRKRSNVTCAEGGPTAADEAHSPANIAGESGALFIRISWFQGEQDRAFSWGVRTMIRKPNDMDGVRIPRAVLLQRKSRRQAFTKACFILHIIPIFPGGFADGSDFDKSPPTFRVKIRQPSE